MSLNFFSIKIYPTHESYFIDKIMVQPIWNLDKQLWAEEILYCKVDEPTMPFDDIIPTNMQAT
jgi:hypothetical protein